MEFLFTIILLGTIIFLHELGHFLTAKYFKMPVKEFSIGMGPKFFSRKKGETVYSLRILPLGGFVNISGMARYEIDKNAIIVETEEERQKIKGENSKLEIYTKEEVEEINYDNEKGFYSKPPFQRFIVLIAGVVMNFLSALIVIFVLIIISKRYADVSILNKIQLAFNNFISITFGMFEGLKQLIIGNVGVKEMTGPIGLPKAVGQIYKMASSNIEIFYIMLRLFVFLSINIGIMNLLPIPALDGGRILFLIPEFLGVKIDKKLEEKIHTIGIIMLLIFMVVVMYFDVLKYF